MNPALEVSIAEHLDTERARVDGELERILPAEDEPPASIHRALRYSVFAGGKRLRPILCLEVGRLFGAAGDSLLRIAASLELVHTYSLIHDDLPALDNDDLRRGKPSSHRVFGEALAILAGDALLTLAFEAVSQPGLVPSGRQLRLVHELAHAVGTRGGMVGGQVVDLETTGSTAAGNVLESIHAAKTGALIRASARCGAIAAGASEDGLACVSAYGEKVGLAFQIADDLLDVLGSREAVGKAVGKDGDKATYPALYGVEVSQRMAERLVAEACGALAGYGERAQRLREIAHFLIARQS
ncbi:MAG TPA: farnesyl diphosphate synthase [Terriglobia bacterium]|nr:farnesyl diphosphate synthase [Terriglobia bacterium]